MTNGQRQRIWLRLGSAGMLALLSVTLSCSGCLRVKPVAPDYIGQLLRHDQATRVSREYPEFFRLATDIAIDAEWRIESQR